MTDNKNIITIDGPSGSGKGTVSKLVAKALGWHLLDSGAIYRGLSLAVLDAGLESSQVDEIVALADKMKLEFSVSPDQPEVMLDGRDVSLPIRAETTGNMASKLAVIAPVRAALLEAQRRFSRAPGLVADGRDMGTTVFPSASLKIYLDASAGERAKRRYKQLKEKGLSANLPSLEKEISERDERDANRAASPLRPAEDALVIDSTELSIEAVVKRILDQVVI